eukprot:TRINITY_DN3556_c0_g1_i2.p1 TRINITY_DN3556_c0_g1~~TRINITY_DN3556_c0_g1_i2.p1  ORF type:complete len:216 (+),score=37.38 TRINITY_DN3556_c0_g1_i2:37-684(+)
MAGVLRVCLAGDAATGKTSLANSLVCGQFSEVPSADTIFSKSLNVDGKLSVVEFVDTSGSGDEYERSRVQLYPSSDLFLILFSIISPTSYESVRARWAPEIRRYCPNKPLLLIGTKADLRSDEDALDRLARRQLAPTSYEQGLKMAKEIGAVGYLEVSATEANVFQETLEQITNVLVPGGSLKKAGKSKKQQRKRAQSAPYPNEAHSDKNKCTLV